MSTSTSNHSEKFFARRFFIVVGIFALIGALLAVYAFLIEPDRLVMNDEEIRVNGWNRELDGFKIVTISDLHGGSNFIDQAKLSDVVKRVNAQSPDLIVILGDFVSQKRLAGPISGRPLKMPMKTIAESIRGLKAKYGVFAVIGNHDDWYDRGIVRTELEEVGITVLVDELKTIEIKGSKISLLGLRDAMSINNPGGYSEEIRPIAEKAEGDLILLGHSPDVFPWITGENAVSEKTRLFLAGHTHGGQVWLPVVGSLVVPSSYGQKYAFGHMNFNNIDIFVTTGIGTSIIPVRFLVPPEIAVLTIKAA